VTGRWRQRPVRRQIKLPWLYLPRRIWKEAVLRWSGGWAAG
jgi:hypothetical protein